MKKISCKDMGMEDCNFVAIGNTDAEVKEKLMHHLKKAHKDKWQSMSEKDKEAMDMKLNGMLSMQK